MAGRLLKAVLGPVFGPVLAALAILAVLGGVYVTGYRAAAGKCEADRIRAERDSALEDLANVQKAADDAAQYADAERERSAKLQAKVKSYAETLKNGDNCRLTNDDIKRLRNIR